MMWNYLLCSGVSPNLGLVAAAFGFLVTFSLQNALSNAIHITDTWEGAVVRVYLILWQLRCKCIQCIQDVLQVGLAVALCGAGLQLPHHMFELRPMGIFWMHQINHAIVCVFAGVFFAVMAQ
jgi:hypothetical protein